MTVTINGESREIPEGLSVAEMLARLEINGDRVAIERNRDILPRAQWQVFFFEQKTAYEIVHFVGGG